MEGLDLKIRKGKRSRVVRVGGGSSSSSSGGASSSSSSSYESEEEAMANCLILLAQGRESHLHHKREGSVKGNGVGLYIYECKTCNRRFPSFQALGGHRASHKKPKLAAPPPPPVTTGYDRFEEYCDNNNVKSGPQNKSNKVHECSICGSEFTSGQALGGHMRRHRASNNTVCNVTVTVAAPPRNILQLDLNLPPPPEDHLRDPNFLLLAAPPALVHCHY